jgi:hypothetical protein
MMILVLISKHHLFEEKKISMEDKLELVVEKVISKQHSANQLVTLKK